MLDFEKDLDASVIEAFKTLRTNILYSSLDKKMKTIMITSAEPAEGKTTSSCNLAISFAKDGKKTLLVDCDLRKPNIHRKFNISNLSGLTDVLVGEEKLEIALENYSDNLDILTSGTKAPNPTEILGSKYMETFLESLKDLYDIIIIDSAPLNSISDSQILGAKVDGVLMVIRANKTKRDSIVEAKDLLEKVSANLLGVVLNGVETSHKKSYYYYGDKNEKKSNSK
ncbi:CpsD/CapB family tyrosine-protein kinase [Clostridium sp. SHJSY1]|uniref:CpsD/CapB family tyrosine-protein kinase n=1 Tax=Clostridium sp. SHJSY1 TaxID=2942483 RepID=UPI0028771EE4|nr:CpsD/CapB family tyrosine-protein kinase [Clostridium sp. SHJSY1]MDS0526516.1 CpsD/CapB family tyrosine-protein kinase [Clostridium sp. SHJSY1]